MGTFELVAIFDLDGTLVDSVEQISRNLNEARIEFGFPAKPQEFYEALIGLPVHDLLSDLTTTPLVLNELVTHFRKLLVLDIQKGNIAIYPGVIELFQLLEGMHIQLAIATSKPTNIALEVIRCSALSSFNVHIQGTDGFPPKPDPAVIRRVLANFEYKKAFMVGDRVEDVIAAHRAGISSIGIAASTHTEVDLKMAGAWQTFNSFEEFYFAVRGDLSLMRKVPIV